MWQVVKTLLVVVSVVVLSGCDGPFQKKKSVLDKECPAFENRFPVKQAEISKDFTQDDCTWVIEYSSFEEAEWKMIHFFFPDGRPEIRYYAEFDYELFQQVILSDNSSMSYPFDSIVQYANITIADSDDGLVRIYSWEEPHPWTMSDYTELIQYRWEGTVLIQGEMDCEEEFCPIAEARSFYVINANDKTYYLVSFYFEEWSSLAYMSFDAFELTKNGLKPVLLFNTEEGLAENIGFEYNIPDWYFKANLGEGYDWLGYYDPDKCIYYLPESSFDLSDRYFQYYFDGDCFNLKEGTVANPFLSPLLRDYVCLVKLLETRRNKIRIDQMDAKTYRYAAWRIGEQMISEPEIVIMDGFFDEASSSYVFMNEGYEYRVDEVDVRVLKNGKLISRWEVYDRWLDE